MKPEFTEYKEAVDGLMTGGFTNTQTETLIEFHERSQNRLRAEMHQIRDDLRSEMHQIRDDLRNEMRAGFKAVDERFEKVEARLDRMDERFDRIYESIGSLKNWLIGFLGTISVAMVGAVITLIALVWQL